MYENRKYLIFPITEVSKIDFTQVCESSEETLRLSLDSTKSFIKWDAEAPSFINDIVGAEGPYTYEEILDILSGSEWTAPMEEV